MSLRPIPECQHVIVNSAAGGTLAAVAAVANQGVGIYRMILTVPSTITVTIQDTGSNALSQPFAFGASGGSITLDTPINGDPWWNSKVGLGIQLNASTTVQVSADIWYLQGAGQGALA
jgi:hypothetical protein